MGFSKFSNFAGVITGVLFLVLAIGLSANDPMAFLNISGLLIVFGGTMTAILVSYPVKEVLPALKQSKVVTASNSIDIQQDIKQILHFSSLWFRQRFAQIDDDLEKLNDHFLKRGLQMVRDRESHEDVMALLNWKISQIRSKETSVINMYRSMATYAPAFGMVGSLVGLVNMLSEMETGGLSSVTSDMAIALVTTFYGLLLANLVFKPIATKLEQRRNQRIIQLTMMAEGVALIQQQRTPSAIRDILMSYTQGQFGESEKNPAEQLLAKFGT